MILKFQINKTMVRKFHFFLCTCACLSFCLVCFCFFLVACDWISQLEVFVSSKNRQAVVLHIRLQEKNGSKHFIVSWCIKNTLKMDLFYALFLMYKVVVVVANMHRPHAPSLNRFNDFESEIVEIFNMVCFCSFGLAFRGRSPLDDAIFVAVRESSRRWAIWSGWSWIWFGFSGLVLIALHLDKFSMSEFGCICCWP